MVFRHGDHLVARYLRRLVEVLHGDGHVAGVAEPPGIGGLHGDGVRLRRLVVGLVLERDGATGGADLEIAGVRALERPRNRVPRVGVGGRVRAHPQVRAVLRVADGYGAARDGGPFVHGGDGDGDRQAACLGTLQSLHRHVVDVVGSQVGRDVKVGRRLEAQGPGCDLEVALVHSRQCPRDGRRRLALRVGPPCRYRGSRRGSPPR